MAKIIFQHGILDISNEDAIEVIASSCKVKKELAEEILNINKSVQLSNFDLIPDPGFKFYLGNFEFTTKENHTFKNCDCVIVKCLQN